MEPADDDTGHALSRVQRAAARKLLSLGYAAGSRPLPAHAGVTRHDPARSGHELMFFVSGHAPEALLIARSGEILHRWRRDYRDAAATDPGAFLPPAGTTPRAAGGARTCSPTAVSSRSSRGTGW